MSDTFGPGTFIDDAAEQVAAIANDLQHKFKATFNGTPLIGYPGDLPRHVAERWQYERLLIQAGVTRD